MDILPSEPDDQQIHNYHSMGKEHLDNHAVNSVLDSPSNRLGIESCHLLHHILGKAWLVIHTVPENMGLFSSNTSFQHIYHHSHNMGKELPVSCKINKEVDHLSDNGDI